MSCSSSICGAGESFRKQTGSSTHVSSEKPWECADLQKQDRAETPVSAFPGEAVQTVELLTLRQCCAAALDSGSCSVHPAALGQQGEEKGRTSSSAEQGVSGRGCPA